ncbi:GNAT family N-acetyltransferase [Aspergillus glaucus CBS 516.65]|uniref:N-acetyltransferase domain-containing protein n=1 Tax=Aspergillus glaucus CBS 516.65 TaxID=1160497 RepID=A0A1L9VR74_ASPGL|nr:hypothetical protein ASPGLDRAFT_44205 [Aspergillus glaucus CBS 516.65]OJJ86413.1 hypothetical protein ASPGLDRAFT_44205 [Aspergillus glaucus CBS 516.65]
MLEGDIHYRYGQLEDSEAIASLGAHVFTISFAQLLPVKDLQKYLLESYSTSSIAAKLKHPSTTFVVAIYDDTLVGFMQLTQGTSEACIDDVKSKIQLQRLYVSEKCQGLGIGMRLMEKAEIEAHKMGIKNIWLASWESNPKAERIYEKAGFVKVGSMKFMLGDAELKDWVMIKAL